jgi:hypothetical protein
MRRTFSALHFRTPVINRPTSLHSGQQWFWLESAQPHVQLSNFDVVQYLNLTLHLLNIAKYFAFLDVPQNLMVLPLFNHCMVIHIRLY